MGGVVREGVTEVVQGAAEKRAPTSASKRALLALLAICTCAFGAAAFAQGGADEPEETFAEGQFAAVERDLADEAAPAVFAVGISAGFPAYQTVALNVSLQAQFVGAQLKGSWTPAGVYLGGQLRAYPPIPVPIPLYVGVGGGIYGPFASYHFAVGTHVPLGTALRLDLEGGVANVPQLDKRGWVPHLAAGISYAFPVELSAATGPTSATVGGSAPQPAARCETPSEPNREQIPGVIDDMVDDFILSARATYGSVYTGLSYGYKIGSVRISGKTANVSVNYSGSVTEILTGTSHSASGTAKVQLTWTGCAWGGGSIDY